MKTFAVTLTLILATGVAAIAVVTRIANQAQLATMAIVPTVFG